MNCGFRLNASCGDDKKNSIGSVGLSASGLPGGSRSSLSPAGVTLGGRGGTSTATSVLTVTTTAGTPAGSYTLKVTGTSGKVSGSITAGLNVNTPTAGAEAIRGESVIRSGKPGDFTISGRVSGLLVPGRSLPLSLNLSNPNQIPLSVISLSVTMEKLTRTPYAIGHHQPCSLDDYAVIQYRGPYPLVVPGSSGLTLSKLGVAADQWPQIQLINRPVNQDGCKGAFLTLSYSGSGHED